MMTPWGARAIPYADFSDMFVTAALLSVSGPVVAFLKDLITIFGRLEHKFPLSTGSVSFFLAVSLSSFASAGCGNILHGLGPQAPAAAQATKLAEISTAVSNADKALSIAQTIQQVEIKAHENGRVSDTAHEIIQQTFKEFAAAARQGLELAKDLSKPETTRMDAARSVGAIGLELVVRIQPHLPPEVATYLGSLRAVLKLLGFSA
jgi:hypothetical protein